MLVYVKFEHINFVLLSELRKQFGRILQKFERMVFFYTINDFLYQILDELNRPISSGS